MVERLPVGRDDGYYRFNRNECRFVPLPSDAERLVDRQDTRPPEPSERG